MARQAPRTMHTVLVLACGVVLGAPVLFVCDQAMNALLEIDPGSVEMRGHGEAWKQVDSPLVLLQYAVAFVLVVLKFTGVGIVGWWSERHDFEARWKTIHALPVAVILLALNVFLNWGLYRDSQGAFRPYYCSLIVLVNGAIAAYAHKMGAAAPAALANLRR